MGAQRYWANSGARFDFEGPHTVGQCKEVKSLSLATLTALAEEVAAEGERTGKLGTVCIKLRRGRGRSSAALVVMTAEQFKDWFSFEKVHDAL